MSKTSSPKRHILLIQLPPHHSHRSPMSRSAAAADDDDPAGLPLLSATSDQYPSICYNPGPRPLRDLPTLLLFLLASLSTFALGILAAARRNPHRRNPCNRPNSLLHPSSSPRLLLPTLLTTLLLSLPAALLLLHLLRRHTKPLVYTAVPLLPLLPAALNAYWFTACTLSPSCRASLPLLYRVPLLIFVFLLILLLVYVIVINWRRVKLTIHIVRVSADALASNLTLLAVLPLLSLAAAAYFVVIIVFLALATMNGEVVEWEREGGGYGCRWKEARWVKAYFALAIVTMVWTLAAVLEAKVYVISGTVAQWYFAKEGERPHRSLRSSLRNAFGPSFGTVCFSGMVMGAVRFVRGVIDTAKKEDAAPGFVNHILRCCADSCLSAVDFVNKFTINFAAITGEGYCTSAKMSYELLKRNLLSAVFVETVSTRTLVGIIFVLSALYAIVVCAILKAVSGLEELETYLVAGLAWLLLFSVLGYFIHVLDNVIDTVYVCYAIDRDKGDVSKQEVHEVYQLLPVSRNHRSTLNSRTPAIV